MALLPCETICTVLINRFLSTLNVAYPVVESMAIHEDMEDFWKTREPKYPMWLACVLAVLGIGYQMPVLAFPHNIEVPNGQMMGKNIITKVTQFVYSFSTKLRRPDTVTFQCFLLLIIVQKLYMEHPDGSDAITGLLSIAGKLAFSMGLHRDPGMFPQLQAAEIRLRRKVNH